MGSIEGIRPSSISFLGPPRILVADRNDLLEGEEVIGLCAIFRRFLGFLLRVRSPSSHHEVNSCHERTQEDASVVDRNVVACVAAAGLAIPAVAQVPAEVVLKTGDPTSAGRTLTNLFDYPVVDNQGRIGIHVSDSGSTSVIARVQPGLFEDVLRSSTVAPGVGLLFNFAAPSSLVSTRDDRFAVRGEFQDPITFAGVTAIVAGVPGSLTAPFRSGTPNPLGGTYFAQNYQFYVTSFPYAVTNSGVVAFNEGSGGFPAPPQGYHTFSSGSGTPLAYQTQVVPGLAPGTFSSFTTNGNTRLARATSQGTLVFWAQTSVPPTSTGAQGLWTVNPTSAPTAVSLINTVPSGYTNAWNIVGVTPWGISETAGVLHAALISNIQTFAFERGSLYRTTSSGTTAIVLGLDPAPGYPGKVWRVRPLDALGVINRQGHVLFKADVGDLLNPVTGEFQPITEAFYVGTPFQPLMALNSQAPFLPAGFNVTTVPGFAINDDGRFVVAARAVRSSPFESRQVLYYGRYDLGLLGVILQTGSAIEVAPGDTRTVQWISSAAEVRTLGPSGGFVGGQTSGLDEGRLRSRRVAVERHFLSL
ncbi:hypothetical protein [Leptolyngbya sp. 7M]|uniref:DUF7453 family protein n=1 Tax=Leptolyngbya sp. 7M TaxID=2812896 RepID=UPI001B8D5864|nr:hypothetical protein [Leptolyngbya sp. 7M]QYO62884.1 hypothetical protein JVX88_23110 [Leptolyngbya sp. 7M]